MKIKDVANAYMSSFRDVCDENDGVETTVI